MALSKTMFIDCVSGSSHVYRLLVKCFFLLTRLTHAAALREYRSGKWESPDPSGISIRGGVN